MGKQPSSMPDPSLVCSTFYAAVPSDVQGPLLAGFCVFFEPPWGL